VVEVEERLGGGGRHLLVHRLEEDSKHRWGEAVIQEEVVSGSGEGNGMPSSSDRDQLSEDCTFGKVTGAACVAVPKLPPYKKRRSGAAVITLRCARTRTMA
jgi:hypothetical protein